MKKKDKTPKTVEEGLIDLYLNVKIRKQDEIEKMNAEMMNEERENLRKTNPLTLMDYIRSSIDILIDLKVDEKLEALKGSDEEDSEEKQNEYETLLRKLENDIRQHIRMEHQLKLHSESLQYRIEELERENSEMTNKNKLLIEKVSQIKKTETKDKKDSEVNVLKSEIQNLKQILKSYEDQSVKMSDLEKKLKTQNTKYEKDMKTLEESYKEKIKIFSKKLASYEEMMKHNSSFRILKKDNEEESDRVNYNDFSQEHSKSPIITTRKSPIITERRKEKESVKEKVDQYRKILDRKINVISQSSVNKTSNLNKSNLTGVDVTQDRSSSNQSFLNKDKTIDNSDTSKSHRKNDSLIKNLESATKKMLAKETNYKTHYRHASMEIKYNKDNSTTGTNSTNTTRSPNAHLNLAKNIHAMKEMLFINKNNPPQNAKPVQKMPNVNNPTSNIILNQGGNPCFNQITIYTSNNNNNNTNNTKANEINLRQYIFNKVTKPKSLSKLGPNHMRSSSINNMI